MISQPGITSYHSIEEHCISFVGQFLNIEDMAGWTFKTIPEIKTNEFEQEMPQLLSCQPRVTVTSRFVYKVIRDL